MVRRATQLTLSPSPLPWQGEAIRAAQCLPCEQLFAACQPAGELLQYAARWPAVWIGAPGPATSVANQEADMAKQITTQFKIQAPGGQATPAPPIGPALGQHGVNPGQFIQQFNDRTKHLNGQVVGCVITVFQDRTFDFEIKSPPAAVLIKDAAGIAKGSGVPNKDKVGTITKSQVREIAEKKIADLNAVNLEAADRIVEGTARSMGVTVEG